MDRRHFLAAVGASLLPATGCLDANPPRSTPDRTSTATPAYDPQGAFRTVRIGERTGEIIPHQVGIWNASNEPRDVRVTIMDASAGERRHDRTHAIPGDTALAVELRAPARYRFTVGVPAVGLERSFEVGRSYFDTCNDSFTHVSIRRTDRITVRTLTTELACLTETP